MLLGIYRIDAVLWSNAVLVGWRRRRFSLSRKLKISQILCVGKFKGNLSTKL